MIFLGKGMIFFRISNYITYSKPFKR